MKTSASELPPVHVYVDEKGLTILDPVSGVRTSFSPNDLDPNNALRELRKLAYTGKKD